MSLLVVSQFAVLITILIGLLVLIFRGPHVPAADPRLLQMLEQITRLEARSDAIAANLREGLADIRREGSENALAARTAAASDSAQLRIEVTGSISTLGTILQAGLTDFRSDNKGSADALLTNVQKQLEIIAQRLTDFASDASRNQIEARESLNGKLGELGSANTGNLEKIRITVEDRLDKLNVTNAAKLEEMRLTVDEKLHATLQTRLTESFGEVTKHLGDVQKGLGEMKELATGVGDLKKVLSNVSRRGGVGEFLVGQQLEQMFSPEQYMKQVNIKAGTGEAVDFALKFPSGEVGSFVLLPIDSKFPTSDWERLEYAYDHGSAEEIAAAGKAFERSIRTQGKSICEKYIDPPTTMPHAIMVLPTESLYAEVVRRPGLQADIQSNCHVTIAGPSTFMAILTSFQMGFQSLKLEKKGHEIRNLLGQAKTQFGKFGDLLGTMETHLGRAQGTLQDLGVRSRAINRALKNVEQIQAPNGEVSNLLGFEEIVGVAPLLAASTDED